MEGESNNGFDGDITKVGGLLVDAGEIITNLVDDIIEATPGDLGVKTLPQAQLGKLEELQVQFDLWLDGAEVNSGKLDAYVGASELRGSLFAIWLRFLQYLRSESEYHNIRV